MNSTRPRTRSHHADTVQSRRPAAARSPRIPKGVSIQVRGFVIASCLLLGLVLPVEGWPFAFESTTGSAGGTGTSCTVSHAVTAANLLLGITTITDGTEADRQVSGVTYNSVAMTPVVEHDVNNAGEHLEIWKLANPDTGTHDMVFTFAGTVDSRVCGAVGFTDASAATGTGVGNSGSGANPSVTVGSAAGDIVVSALVTDLGSSGTTTEDGTLLFEVENTGPDSYDHNAQRQVAAGASTVASWTSAADIWTSIGVAVKPAAAPAVRRGTLLGVYP